MADYYTIIADLNPSAEHIRQARAYALEQITGQVLESDPFAKIALEGAQVSIGSENSDFTHSMQYEFEALFESKLRQLRSDEANDIHYPA